MKLKISVTFKIKRRRTKTEHPEIKQILCENAQQFEIFEIVPMKQKQKGAHSEYFDKINGMSTDGN